jgi:hypothetical protein
MREIERIARKLYEVQKEGLEAINALPWDWEHLTERGREKWWRYAAGVLGELREAPPQVIEAGAIGIMNERLAQKGMPPLENLDMLYPHVLLEMLADAKASWQAMIAATLKE